MKKMWVLWVLAVLITLAAAVYQRMTGPTYPIKGSLSLDGNTVVYKFPRSAETGSSQEILLNLPDERLEPVLEYKRLKTTDDWQSINMKNLGAGDFLAYLPAQPPAGKLIYQIEIKKGDDLIMLPENHPVIIRFKGSVPPLVLIPHVLFMFLAMLISNLAGITAIARKEKSRLYAFIAFGLVLVGGMIMGPVVQKYAFGEFWTGVPFGWDLTDNKTLIGFIGWGIAVVMNWREKRPGWILFAAILLLVIFSIPHSMFGSELNYETGIVGQG